MDNNFGRLFKLICYAALIASTSAGQNGTEEAQVSAESNTLYESRQIPIESCVDQNIISLEENFVTVQPFPVNFPGSLNASIEFKMKSDDEAKMIAESLVKLTIGRHIPLLTSAFDTTLHVPCVSEFGSCTRPLKTYLPELSKALSLGKTEIKEEEEDEDEEEVLACFKLAVSVTAESRECSKVIVHEEKVNNLANEERSSFYVAIITLLALCQIVL